MTEQEPTQFPEPELKDFLSTHLWVPAEPRLHAAFGEGYHYALGPNAPEESIADFEIYPDVAMLRYTAQGSDITMRGEQVSGEYTEAGLIFESNTEEGFQLLSLTRDGGVVFISHPGPRKPLTVFAPESAAADPWNGQPAAADEVSQKEQKEQQEKVKLEGRAGRDARLSETKTGKKIAKFPLAVHEEVDGEKQTTWHTIVAFNTLAERVGEDVKKGSKYSVVGYVHESEHEGKVRREIYAVNVKARPTGNDQEGAPKNPAG